MESSSSDDSDSTPQQPAQNSTESSLERPVSRKRRFPVNEQERSQKFRLARQAPAVDFEAIGQTRWGGPFGMSHVEQDRLIGWATNDDPVEGPPLPPTMLRHMIEAYGERLSERLNLPEAFDQSSLVALGMAIEDQLNTYLLPMARRHVERCRQMENATAEWTLPPEEAILKLAVDTAAIDTNSNGSPDEIAKVAEWCQARKLQYHTRVRGNMELYRYLIPEKFLGPG